MALQDIALLPDSSRLFIYHTAHELAPEEETLLRMKLEGFLDQWAAHGSNLTVGFEMRYSRFIIIAVDDSKVGPSGCSIDASTQFLRGFSLRSGIEILEAPEICYRAARQGTGDQGDGDADPEARQIRQARPTGQGTGESGAAAGVDCTTRGGFQQLADRGEVSASTIVFDNTLARLADLRAGRWEKAASESWHARAFELA